MKYPSRPNEKKINILPFFLNSLFYETKKLQEKQRMSPTDINRNCILEADTGVHFLYMNGKCLFLS